MARLRCGHTCYLGRGRVFADAREVSRVNQGKSSSGHTVSVGIGLDFCLEMAAKSRDGRSRFEWFGTECRPARERPVRDLVAPTGQYAYPTDGVSDDEKYSPYQRRGTICSIESGARL